jgi:hypothetical protein
MSKPEFVKLHTKMLDSSVVDLEIPYRWCWTALLLMVENYEGEIYGTVGSLARRAGVDTELMQDALDIFMSGDENSTTPDEEGRRIKSLGTNKWKVINFQKHMITPSAEKRKQDYRLSKQRLRALEAGLEHDEEQAYRDDCDKYHLPVRQDVLDSLWTSTYKDKDKDKDRDKEVPTVRVVSSNSKSVVTGKRKPVFENPPTAEEIYEYFLEKGYSKKNAAVLDLAKEIVEHHESGGNWRQGNGKPIYVWKSHALQWARNRNLPEDLMAKSRKNDEVRRVNAKM